ncbi:ImmA/IrrE family metallo-endopeptidase [Alkalinema pantanalense CENA528]|uniref:ImmA/IrrE family metallo-endopeptidase n=1 Tax=Alkalinema pantanalense TaxID=1620705 RepID=UPI003D6E7ED2
MSPLPPRYQHPGYAFLHRYGSLQTEADVFHYVEFLRESAGLSNRLPTDLDSIYSYFGMPIPLRVPLNEQQGILLDTYKGVILIKEDDPIVRQRFTEGHELMELLFDAQADVAQKLNIPTWDEARKEKLCDAGAAELLMPRSQFSSHLNHLGVSLETARSLSALYQTSLLATLIRMVELASGQHALIVWHRSLKPSERKAAKMSRASTEQSQAQSEQFKPEQSKPEYLPKLRIWWRVTSPDWQAGFLPRDKSIEDTSLIAQALTTGQTQKGQEVLQFGWGTIDGRIEAMSVQIGDKPCIISLLHA